MVMASVAQAYEVTDVCAKYVNSGKAYKVEAIIADGGELNRAWDTWKFTSYAKYVVIFWDEDQYTVIKLDFSSLGISVLGSTGTDQEGRPWSVSKSTFCI